MEKTKLLNMSEIARIFGSSKVSPEEAQKSRGKKDTAAKELNLLIKNEHNPTLQKIEKALNLPDYQTLGKLMQYIKKDIVQKFTKMELFALCGANNPGNIDFQQDFVLFNPSVFFAGMEDAERLDADFSKMEGVDWETIKPKIAGLSRAECYFLQRLIHQFWNEPESYGHEDVHFEDFYKSLSK